MDKDKAIAVLNELLLPLRLAGVECGVSCYSHRADIVVVNIEGYGCAITFGEGFEKELNHLYYVFSTGLSGDNSDIIMGYFRACLRNSGRTLACLLEDHNDA